MVFGLGSRRMCSESRCRKQKQKRTRTIQIENPLCQQGLDENLSTVLVIVRSPVALPPLVVLVVSVPPEITSSSVSLSSLSSAPAAIVSTRARSTPFMVRSQVSLTIMNDGFCCEPNCRSLALPCPRNSMIPFQFRFVGRAVTLAYAGFASPDLVVCDISQWNRRNSWNRCTCRLIAR